MLDITLKGRSVNTGVVDVDEVDVTQILPANPRRVRATLQNVDDTNHVFIGGADLEADKSISLSPGAAAFDGKGGMITLVTQGAIYGLADTANVNVAYLEESA